MKLVVGLGNPGKDYANTRHNMGFNLLDTYVDYMKIDDKWASKFDGKYIITNINGDKVLFLKPQTYMNLSGDSVRKVVDYYNIDIDDILVISDDLDLNVGNYKLKMYGSCGGHNGLRDIENKLGTNHFKRLKIGISNDKDIDTKDYVTSNMSKHDKDIIDNLYKELCHVLDDYFVLDFGDLMSKYNRKNK